MRSFQRSKKNYLKIDFLFIFIYKPVWLYDELILQSALTLNLRSVYSGLSDIFFEKRLKNYIIYI